MADTDQNLPPSWVTEVSLNKLITYSTYCENQKTLEKEDDFWTQLKLEMVKGSV